MPATAKAKTHQFPLPLFSDSGSCNIILALLIVLVSTADTESIAPAPARGSFEKVTELLRVEWQFARDDTVLIGGNGASQGGLEGRCCCFHEGDSKADGGG